jgi:8-oxo-dGTP pyrophosphatase MutT (NUDIX family)
LRLARARSKSAARTYVPKEANEGRSPYLSASDKHVEDLGIYPMYMDEDGGNASWIEDIGHDSVMELDTRMRAEGWRQEKEAGMREKHNIKMRINVSDSEAAEGVAKILNELKMYGDIGTSREIKIREMGKITRKKVKEAGYRLSTGFDGDGSGRIDKVTKGKDYVECSAENVKYPDDWHGMRDFFNGIKIVLDGGRGAEVFRDYAEEKGGSEQICFIDGDGGEHIKSITYDEQTFIDKEARDEIVKLTYHKSSKKPYRQRSEVLAYDSETGEIVCRIKRSHVGGLYVELPGGGIDKGESPRTAAKREALEEAGITLKNIEQVGRCRWKWPKTHQNAMGTWADLYAGDDTFIFIAEVDTKGKPTSEEGDGWDRLQTRSIDKLRTFLKTHKKEGTMIMQDCRLAALRKLETKITQTSAQLPLTKSASTTTLLNEDTTQESNMHNAAGFMAGYMAKTGHNKEASLNKEARNIEGGQASFLKALFPTMNIYGPGEDITPREISNPHTRETFKLNANEMRTGQDTRKAYS